MVENGFYLLDQSYINLIKALGGKYNDSKARPMFCCIKDNINEGLYWLIPTGDLSHRSQSQKDKINLLLREKGIRSAYYHIGQTNKPALFKISNALPVSEKYISREYTSCGVHLILQDKKQISEIKNKLFRILSYEAQHPNKLEQKITAVKEYICRELQQEIDDEKRKLPMT